MGKQQERSLFRRYWWCAAILALGTLAIVASLNNTYWFGRSNLFSESSMNMAGGSRLIVQLREGFSILHPILPSVAPRWFTLETNGLWWSPNDPRERTGWLMFWQPFSTNAVWEFAPTSKAHLQDVNVSDFETTFARMEDPLGEMLYGTNWGTNAIRVKEGDILLARRVDGNQRTYAILIKKSALDHYDWATVEYRVIARNEED